MHIDAIKARAPHSVKELYWHLLEAKRGRFLVREAAWQCVSRLPEFTITRATRHGRFAFSSRDSTIGRWLFVTGAFEYDLIERALDVASSAGYLAQKNEGALLDIGANIGTVCVPLVMQRKFSRAIAVEPDPANYERLTGNIELNALRPRVTTFNCAVSSRAGSATMQLAPGNAGDRRVMATCAAPPDDAMGEGSWKTIQVSVETIDDLVARADLDPADIRLMWVDVQGHEKHVLEGAERVLRVSRAPVVMELWPYALARAGVSADDLTLFLSSRFPIFFDLSEAEPQRLPISALGSMFDRYAGLESTNLLLGPYVSASPNRRMSD